MSSPAPSFIPSWSIRGKVYHVHHFDTPVRARPVSSNVAAAPSLSCVPPHQSEDCIVDDDVSDSEDAQNLSVICSIGDFSVREELDDDDDDSDDDIMDEDDDVLVNNDGTKNYDCYAVAEGHFEQSVSSQRVSATAGGAGVAHDQIVHALEVMSKQWDADHHMRRHADTGCHMQQLQQQERRQQEYHPHCQRPQYHSLVRPGKPVESTTWWWGDDKHDVIFPLSLPDR